MREEDKERSIKYWNHVANKWGYMAHGEDGHLLTFPTSQVRHDIIANEIVKTNKREEKILDIGCADGKLARILMKNGYSQILAIDNAPMMIKEAKRQMKEQFSDIDSDGIFAVGDADNLLFEEKFDFITAMGLIEYVQNVDSFLSRIANLLNVGGIAYIE